MKLEEFVEYLACPTTRKCVRLVDLSNQGEAKPNPALRPVRRTGSTPAAIGQTSRLLMDESSETAYPVVGEFPVLMAPELLVPKSEIDKFGVVDLADPRYAEAYEEMEVYNTLSDEKIRSARESGHSELQKPMGALIPTADLSDADFPLPENLWIDARHDAISQLEAYTHLAPVHNSVVLQLGGSGTHAIKMLRAGASKAFLLTQMIGEARVAMQLAEDYGVSEKLGCVIGIGEEIPLSNETIDLVYSGGCFHHMRLSHAAKELHRILREGGKFSGVDSWKTPLHTIGTTLIGKREKSVFCKPITPERLAPMQRQFGGMFANNHGPLLRYLFLAFEKLGVQFPIPTMLRIGRFDDSFCEKIGLKRFGGSLMIAGTKRATPPRADD